MRIRLSLSSFAERLRASLFFIPMIAVVSAVLLGLGGLALDEYVNERATGRLPFGLTSTVESARALLSTIAGATIAFAGIAFSVSLLIIQLASSQYSPRVVHTMFRDPFNKRVMALVVGTFTYCVIVLRSVRSPLEEGGDAVIPNLSVMVAVVLGIATILAIVASINHSAHSMDVSEILENIRREATASIRREWSPAEPGTRPSEPPEPLDEPSCAVRFDRAGWVQQLDADALLRCVPEGGVVRLETHPGRYAIEGTPFPMSGDTPTPPASDDLTVVEFGRRQFLLTGLAGVAFGPAFLPRLIGPAAAGPAFLVGAASGDPLGGSRPVRPGSPGADEHPRPISTPSDPALSRVVASGTTVAAAGPRSHHPRAGRRLAPGTACRFRFEALGQMSPVGRTRTAAPEGQRTGRRVAGARHSDGYAGSPPTSTSSCALGSPRRRGTAQEDAALRGSPGQICSPVPRPSQLQNSPASPMATI